MEMHIEIICGFCGKYRFNVEFEQMCNFLCILFVFQFLHLLFASFFLGGTCSSTSGRLGGHRKSSLALTPEDESIDATSVSTYTIFNILSKYPIRDWINAPTHTHRRKNLFLLWRYLGLLEMINQTRSFGFNSFISSITNLKKRPIYFYILYKCQYIDRHTHALQHQERN